MSLAISIDGGGIRGVIPSQLIHRLDTLHSDWYHKADIIAGVSTGAVIALGLALGIKPADIVDFYLDRASSIFRYRDWHDWLTPDETWRANYDINDLRAVLESVFGDAKLEDLIHRVLIPSLNLRTGIPEFYDSSQPQYKGLSVVEVALRSSAAPTYFASHNGFVDGSVVANNPSDCVVASLQNDGVPTGSIKVLSFGTDKNKRSMEGGDWGLSQWAKPIIPLLIEGPTAASVYRTKRAIGERFMRIDPELMSVVDLDDTEAIPDLLSLANEQDLSSVSGWLRKHWL